MLSVFRKQLKVFRRIIPLVPVFMVNNFLRQKKPANHLFHHKTMLKNIGMVLPLSWVVQTANEHITVFVNYLTTLPKIVLCSLNK